MLNDVVPKLSRASLMFNPATAPYYDVYVRSFETVPRSIKAEVTATPIRERSEIEASIIKLARNLSLPHAENCAVEVEVLAPRQFRMKACADFEQ